MTAQEAREMTVPFKASKDAGIEKYIQDHWDEIIGFIDSKIDEQCRNGEFRLWVNRQKIEGCQDNTDVQLEVLVKLRRHYSKLGFGIQEDWSTLKIEW